MFRASQHSSLEDQIVLIHHLVWFVSISSWPAYQAVTYTD